jgi:hypothetical protein
MCSRDTVLINPEGKVEKILEAWTQREPQLITEKAKNYYAGGTFVLNTSLYSLTNANYLHIILFIKRR